MLVSISGNIGTGKTTLVRALELSGWISLEERPEDNPFLAAFYEDPVRYAFSSQIAFLVNKYRLLQSCAPNQPAVIERTIAEDALFAYYQYKQGYLSSTDYQTYRLGYRRIARSLRTPNLVIYLRCPASVALERILKRGRPYERNLPSTYWMALMKLYDRWAARWRASPIISIDTGAINLRNEHTIHDVLQRIHHHPALTGCHPGP